MSDDTTNHSDTLHALHAKIALLEAENRLLREEAFVFAERLQKADAGSHADFLAAAAHELRTPLTSIKGYVEVMLDGDTGDLSPVQHEFLRIVGGNADRLNTLINQLLEIARIEARRVMLTREVFDTRILIDDVLEAVRPMYETRKVRVSVVYAEDVPQVWGDRDRLHQALRSLFEHACTATFEGDRVLVEIESLEGNLVIRVHNNGVGIAEKDMLRIFTHFYRPPTLSENTYTDTHLNLATARAIIEMHNGTITAENTATGTMFSITLPAVRDAVPSATAAPRTTITVAADDPRFITLCQEIGRTEGYVVQLADSDTRISGLLVVNGAEMRADVADVVMSLAPLELELLNAGAVAVLSAETTMAEIVAATGVFDSALCISPDALTLRHLDKLLHDGGCTRVLRATMEHDGLMLARRHTPPLIILDARPSGSIAFDTLDSLHANNATRNIPVVALVEPIALPAAPFATIAGENLARPVTRARIISAIANAVRSS